MKRVQNMFRNKMSKRGACLIGFLGLACAAGQVTSSGLAQEKAGRAARTTGNVPSAREAVPPAPGRADIAKTETIEPAALAVIQHKSTAPAAPDKAFVNAHVAPGKVHWHATFADACQAAQKSRKPVLLFHMMGKLDDLFC